MVQTSYADLSSITFGYDAAGNLTTMTDSTGTTNYVYDTLNRLVRETLPNGQVISYGWDGRNNLTSRTDSGGTQTRGYNALGLLSSLTDPSGSTITFGYDAAYRNTQVAYPNGVTETISYNLSGQVRNMVATNRVGTALTSFSYSYAKPATTQPLQLRYSMIDAAGNATAYQYDALDRLTGATKTSPGGVVLANYQYAYDAVGNLASQNLNGAITTMTYNGANELTQAGPASYSHDGNGGTTGNSLGLALTYNAADQTVGITPPGGAPVTMAYTDAGQTKRVLAGTKAFQYDLLGLSAMTIGTATTYFSQNPDGARLSERMPTGLTIICMMRSSRWWR